MFDLFFHKYTSGWYIFFGMLGKHLKTNFCNANFLCHTHKFKIHTVKHIFMISKCLFLFTFYNLRILSLCVQIRICMFCFQNARRLSILRNLSNSKWDVWTTLRRKHHFELISIVLLRKMRSNYVFLFCLVRVCFALFSHTFFFRLLE